jgi:histidyl-tRNA synthetase
MGDVTLADFLLTHGLMQSEGASRPQLYLGTPNLEDIGPAQTLADQLRTDGARVFVNLTDRSLGDQVKEAVKRSIPIFIAYGADEVASGAVRVKTLSTSRESVMPISELSEWLRVAS